MKLTSKMAWVIASSVLLTVVLLAVMIHVLLTFVSGYNHATLRNIGDRLAERLERADTLDEHRLTREMRQLRAEYEDIGMELFGSDGRLLYSSANRTEDYETQELLMRFADQPNRLFRGQDTSVVYAIEPGGNRYYVAFDVEGEALQEVQLFLYLNQWAPFPFLIVPVVLIIALPAAIAFVFVLFMTRRLNRLNGAMREADLQREPVRLRDEAGDEIGTLTRLFNDMSDKLHRQYAHTRSIEQARVKLIAHLSHDLRTPLSIIQGYAETLQRGSAHDADTRIRHSTIIVQKSEYMNGLLQQLFRTAELDDPSAAIRMEQGDIRPLLQSIVAEYVHVWQDRGIEWEAELPDSPVSLVFDRDSMAQALRNLIDNALLHGSDGRYVGVRLRVMDEAARIEVEDRGKGIPVEELERVFERFYRVDKGRRTGGMGIGLALASEIVNRHGGKIEARSAPFASTVFAVVMPLAAARPGGASG